MCHETNGDDRKGVYIGATYNHACVYVHVCTDLASSLYTQSEVY